jgi:hypothetical protein
VHSDLSYTSTIDGASIAAAALISWRMGLVAAVGIIIHDITDGLNTILPVTRGGSPEPKDFAFLAADAIAPILGGTLVLASAMSTHQLALVLGMTSGFFLFTATGSPARRSSPFGWIRRLGSRSRRHPPDWSCCSNRGDLDAVSFDTSYWQGLWRTRTSVDDLALDRLSSTSGVVNYSLQHQLTCIHIW